MAGNKMYITANSRSYCVNHSVVYEMSLSTLICETVHVIKSGHIMAVQYFHFRHLM